MDEIQEAKNELIKATNKVRRGINRLDKYFIIQDGVTESLVIEVENKC